jgi:hypothetical protein
LQLLMSQLMLDAHMVIDPMRGRFFAVCRQLMRNMRILCTMVKMVIATRGIRFAVIVAADDAHAHGHSLTY